MSCREMALHWTGDDPSRCFPSLNDQVIQSEDCQVDISLDRRDSWVTKAGKSYP